MLYQYQEFQRALLQPLTAWAQATAKTFVIDAIKALLIASMRMVRLYVYLPMLAFVSLYLAHSPNHSLCMASVLELYQL